MVLISEKVSAITHNTNSNLTTTSSGSNRPPFSDGVRYGQMDRHENNRQFCAFNGKQEMQLGGDVTDHDHDSLSDQKQSEAFSQDYLLEHNKPNVKFNFFSINVKNKSSCGYEFIFNKHIKYARNVLTTPLTLLIN